MFAVLLGFEWRYRLRSVRITAAVLALASGLFAQPLSNRAARRVIAAPMAERVTRTPDGTPLSDYESGVLTMEEAVVEDVMMGAPVRLLSVGALFWLACSPVFRRRVQPPKIADQSGGERTAYGSGTP